MVLEAQSATCMVDMHGLRGHSHIAWWGTCIWLRLTVPAPPPHGAANRHLHGSRCVPDKSSPNHIHFRMTCSCMSPYPHNNYRQRVGRTSSRLNSTCRCHRGTNADVPLLNGWSGTYTAALSTLAAQAHESSGPSLQHLLPRCLHVADSLSYTIVPHDSTNTAPLKNYPKYSLPPGPPFHTPAASAAMQTVTVHPQQPLPHCIVLLPAAPVPPGRQTLPPRNKTCERP